MEEFTITVTIADRIYRLTIERKEEEAVRKAARLIEEKTKEYAKNYAYKDKQDLLAMVALEYTTSYLQKEQKANEEDHDVEQKLESIDAALTGLLYKQSA